MAAKYLSFLPRPFAFRFLSRTRQIEAAEESAFLLMEAYLQRAQHKSMDVDKFRESRVATILEDSELAKT